MKKIMGLLLIVFIHGCSAEKPIQFSEAALNENLVTLNGETQSLGETLETYRGKSVLIDVWASWCADCIRGMPTVKELQQEFKDVEFVFLSVDRSEAVWKRSIQRYGVQGEHYFVPTGQKGAFGKFLNSNWIPRYMVVDREGNIKLFKAKKATDARIKEALN